MILAGEFRRQVVTKGIFGFDDERYRKIARVFQRHTQIVAEGFSAVTEDATIRGRGGSGIGGVEVAFVVLAALEQGPLNEELADKCWRIYTAPCQTLAPGTDLATFHKQRGELRCPITGEHWGGRALRDVLADTQLAKRVDYLMLHRHTPELVIAWKGRQLSSRFFRAADQDAWLKAEAPEVQAIMQGRTLLWLSQVTQPAPGAARRH